MVLEAAQWWAEKLMREHGLDRYSFEWNNRKRGYGLCDYRGRTIQLSRILTPHCTKEQVVDTILHEIAHALTPGHHHDEVWRAKAIEIGCSGTRCGSHLKENGVVLQAKYSLTCEKCDYSVPRHKDMGDRYTHNRCGGQMKFIRNK